MQVFADHFSVATVGLEMDASSSILHLAIMKMRLLPIVHQAL